jgi:uncharacterized membrane protein
MRFESRVLSVLFMFVLFMGSAHAGISVANYTVSKASFQPGDVGIATVTITNPVGSPRVSGLAMTIYNPAEIAVPSAPSLADIETGGMAVVSIPLRIKPDAKPGIYLLNVAFTGFSTQSGSTTQTSTTNTVSVPIIIVDAPILSITTDTPVLGGITPTVLTLTNNGGLAKNLRISTSGIVGLYGTDEIFVGDLKDRKAVNVTLDVRNAPDGPLDVPFTVIYDDELGTPHTESDSMRVTIKNEVLDLRFNQLSQLVTRKDGNLTLEVVNNGQLLSDVRISFVNSSLSLKDKSELKAGDLGPGEKVSVSGLVYSDLAPGLNLVPASVVWTDRDVRKEQLVNIPITIGSDADVSVYLESKPSPLTNGQEHTISVLVSNVGSYGIDNVDVGLNSSAFESLDITPRQYIGSLAKDDFSTVQFKVRVTAGEGVYPVSVNVRYRDASGEWVTKTISQTASVKAPQENGSGTLYIVGAVAVLAVAGLWFFKFRKKSIAS